MLNPQQLKQEFIHRYGEFEVETYFSPGRVNVIGVQIGYKGGFCVAATI